MPDNVSVDVLVVGGGPAGLAAARAAAEAGARTLLIERDPEIGAPIRTSGASWYADLRELGIPLSLAHPVERLRFVAPDREAEWRYREPLACVLDVRGLYQHLAVKAARAGVTIWLRHTAVAPLLGLEGEVVGAEVRDDLGRISAIRAAVTVDASGSSATLSTKVGLRGTFRRLGVGAELDLHAPAFDQRMALLLVGRQVAPRGYAWAFPRGDERVRVGVGVIRPDTELDPKALLARLLSHPALAKALRSAQPLEYHTGVLPSEPLGERLSAGGLLVAGDSAAQASPLLGEGIRYAIRAGRLAGQVAAQAVRVGDCSADFLARYDRAWRARFGREMAVAYWLNRRFARYGDRNWRVVAALLAPLSPSQVATGLHGDFRPRWWLGLAAKTPWLVGAAAGALRGARP